MFSQEIETYYLIPAIRREIAKIMIKKGQTQQEVALKLKLTKSAVSQYVSGKRGKKFVLSKGTVEECCAQILNGVHYLRAIQDLLIKLKSNKEICKIYAQNSVRPEDCEVCKG
jgi:predicted transcriptional regulator